jgi:hypothetical protein
MQHMRMDQMRASAAAQAAHAAAVREARDAKLLLIL